MYRVVLLLAALFAAFASAPSFAAGSFSDAQRAEIEGIVKDYLVNKNPEVMAEGLQKLDQRRHEEMATKAKEKVATEHDKIFSDPATPVGGNPNGSVTIVEFYDYGCGYCKMGEEAIEKVMKEDKDIKFVYKNYPILGPSSLEAAKAGLASVRQGKFAAFHSALMNIKERLTSEAIYKTAKSVGLDVAKLKKDMASKEIGDAVEASLKLGQDIGAQGTPYFIINETVYPGVLQYEQLKGVVDTERQKVKK